MAASSHKDEQGMSAKHHELMMLGDAELYPLWSFGMNSKDLLTWPMTKVKKYPPNSVEICAKLPKYSADTHT